MLVDAFPGHHGQGVSVDIAIDCNLVSVEAIAALALVTRWLTENGPTLMSRIENLGSPAQSACGSTLRDRAEWQVLEARLATLYQSDAALQPLLDRLAARLDRGRMERAPALVAMDRARLVQPDWTAASGHTIYTFYVDRFSHDLKGLIDRLDYLQALGVRWLHPLPLLKARPGDNDGGFAVADFRQVEPRLGDMDDLNALTAALRARGMGLLLDVVCNHTAMEHDWAVRARAGDPAYRDFYRVVETPEQVVAWETHLVDVFPDTAPGSFTYDADMGGHVWTTFYPFQWDLNYANPAVFEEMLGVLIFLANQGVDGFRLDSAPFLWKREGTNCRNQPEAYAIVEAWRAALAIVSSTSLRGNTMRPSSLMVAPALRSASVQVGIALAKPTVSRTVSTASWMRSMSLRSSGA